MNFGWKAITGYFLGYLLVYLLTHTSWDIIMVLKPPGKAKYPYPKSANILAVIGFCISTILFWISIIIIPIRSLIFKSDIYNSHIISEEAQPIVRCVGMVIMSIGLLVGALGRWARGNYTAHNHIKLQTRLGFAIVRHPNYFQYYCGFIGVPLISLHMFTLILPLIGIFGYYVIAKEEEGRLALEFGEEYRDYKHKVGMFFPRFSLLFQTKERYTQSIFVRKAQFPACALVRIPIMKQQNDERKWGKRILMMILENQIIRKEMKNHPSHPYYSSNENSGKFNYHIYAQTMR